MSKKTIKYNSNNEKRRWLGYFDLLGIQNVIKHNNTVSVFVIYQRAIEQIIAREAAIDNVEYVWFSDTFLIYTIDDSIQSFRDINFFCRWFAFFLITGSAVPVPVRGSISCDSLYVDKENDLFFGKGLVEAYEYGESQNWIGFILCPSAQMQLEVLGYPAELRVNYAYTNIPYNKRESKLIKNLPACILGQGVSPNPCIDSLIKMRDMVTDDKIIEKYQNSIEFIQRNKRELAFEAE